MANSNLTKEQLEQISQVIASYPEHEREEKAREMLSELQQQQGPVQEQAMQAQPQQCPYCLIAENKIKAIKIFEDPDCVAVLEINPANPGHIIFFPKKHIKDFSSLTENETEQLFKIAKNLTSQLSKISEGVNILVSEGAAAGQRFPHLTINIIPRFKDDGVQLGWAPKKVTEDELNKLKERLTLSVAAKEIKEEEKPDFEAMKKKVPKPEERIPAY